MNKELPKELFDEMMNEIHDFVDMMESDLFLSKKLNKGNEKIAGSTHNKMMEDYIYSLKEIIEKYRV